MKIRRGDVVIIIVIATLAVVSAAILIAMMLIPQKNAAPIAVITCDSGQQELSLDSDAVLELYERGIALRVQVADGRVRVEWSECPDGICVAAGWLEHEGEVAVCLPAGVIVRILWVH